MNKRKLADLEVSEIGMGCMGFSHGYGKVPSREYAIQAIREAYEYGCNFFDTADGYGKEQFYPGHNEQILGEAVKDFRDDVILATKLHITTKELDHASLEDVIRNHLQKSLINLQTDHVELYYLHRINEDIRVEDVALMMKKLIQEGLIHAWGLSQVSVETLKKANEVTKVSAVQNLYSIVERDCENDIFPYCLENDILVVPFSPISSGFLSGNITIETKFEEVDDVRHFVPQLTKENIHGNQPILDVIKELAARKKATPAQISLSWMLHKYPNVVPIPGAKKKEHIIENLKASEVHLTQEEFTKLESELAVLTIHGHRGHIESEQKTFANNWKK